MARQVSSSEVKQVLDTGGITDGKDGTSASDYNLVDLDNINAAGIEKVLARGETPVVVISSTMTPPERAVSIIDDQTIAQAVGDFKVSSLVQDPHGRCSNATLVFAGPAEVLNEAISQGRLPPTQTILNFQDNNWCLMRALEKVQESSPPQPPRQSSDTISHRGIHLLRNAPISTNKLRESLLVRRLQPYIDKRCGGVLETLVNPGAFPFNMSYYVEGRVIVALGSLFHGGAERQALNTIEGLRARSIDDVHLFVENLDEGTDNAFYLERARAVAASIIRPAQEDYQITDWGLSQPKFRSVVTDSVIGQILNAAETIKRLSPEIVHVSLDWPNITVGLAAVLAGVPRVFLSGRNLGPHHFEFFQWFMYPCYQALAAHPRVQLLNNSDAGRNDYASWLRIPNQAVHVLRNGLHSGSFKPVDDEVRNEVRTTLKIEKTAKVIVGAFRLSDEKRPLLWVEAAGRIKAAFPDAVFLLCGVGKMQDAVEERAARLGISKNFKLLGVRKDIHKIFAAADLVMLTSLQEGTPNTLIEAQAMGVPVVTTPAFGAAEAVEHGVTGVVVRKETASGIGAAAIEVLKDQGFSKQARVAGPDFIERRFGMERMIDDTLQVYADAGAEWVIDKLHQTE